MLNGMPSLFDIPVNTLSGQPTTLEPYKGKVMLIVNTASKCGLTPQYEGLEKLYGTYKQRGFEVLGFPANDFAGQEPGTSEEIKNFCESKFNISFPMFEKVVASGPNKSEIYKVLTGAQPVAKIADPGFHDKLRGYGLTVNDAPEISWNFEKFVVNRNGEVVARFAPDTAPDDPSLIQAIEQALPPLEGATPAREA